MGSREEFVEVAEGVLGLKEAEVVAGRIVQGPLKAVVAFRESGARETPAVIPLGKFKALAIMPELAGERIRVASHGAYFLHGKVYIGGNAEPDASGSGGLWTVISASSREAVGQTQLKPDLPEGARAVPEGTYKDGKAPPEKRYSLWYLDPRDAKEMGKRFAGSACLVAQAAAKMVEGGELAPTDSLVAPRVLVGASRVMPRFVQEESALAGIDGEVAWRAVTGNWRLPELFADTEGVVSEVADDGISVSTADEELLYPPPAAEVAEALFKATGFHMPDLQLVPAVEKGDTVVPDSVLFAPVSVGPYAPAELTKRQVLACRLLALMSSAVEAEGVGVPLYPFELVAPMSADQVYLEVAGDEIGDIRMQRVTFKRSPNLAAAGAGIEIDLYNSSQRTETLRRIREAKAKALASAKLGQESEQPA